MPGGQAQICGLVVSYVGLLDLPDGPVGMEQAENAMSVRSTAATRADSDRRDIMSSG